MAEYSKWIRPGWYLAICKDCTPVLPQPFQIKLARDEWADAHVSNTRHEVVRIEADADGGARAAVLDDQNR